MDITDSKLFKHAYGCLAGVAVGDAMGGMPSSLMTPCEIRSQIGRIEWFLPAPEGHYIHDGLAAGSTTDDTAQTLAVAQAVISDKGKVVPESVAREILAWAESIGALEEGGALVLGPSSMRALSLLGKKGVPAAEAGKFGGETQRGGAHAYKPMGIINAGGDPAGALDDTELCCLPTHGTSVAISGAAAVSCGIAKALACPESIEEIVDAAGPGGAEQGGATRGRVVAAPSIAKRIQWAVDWRWQRIVKMQLVRSYTIS